MSMRVAILGAGIGAQHVDGFLALPDRFSIALICDLDQQKARDLAAKAPDCGVSDDLDAVLADASIDVIDICLPPHLHGPIAKRALAAGKHVICEKPMAGSVIEADEMAAAADAAGRVLTPVFQYRYGRGLAALGALQAAGLAGKPLVATLETHWDRGAEYYAVPWRGTWARERGGAVLGHAIHIHDLVTRFFGPVTAVNAMIDTCVNPIETEDCAAIGFECESGGLVTSSITLGGAGDQSRLRFVFDRMTAESARNPYAPGQAAWVFTARNPDDQAAVDACVAASTTTHEGYAGQFAALAETIAGNNADLVTAADGVRSVEGVAAIYLAAREGRRVTLPLDRAHPICANWVPET